MPSLHQEVHFEAEICSRLSQLGWLHADGDAALFDRPQGDNDQLVYVNGALKGKLLENETLVRQAASNSKEQFAHSPDLRRALVDAIMDALDAHQPMSSQALASERVQDGLREVLLGLAQLYEALKARSHGDDRR